jgi:hypothetical protein
MDSLAAQLTWGPPIQELEQCLVVWHIVKDNFLQICCRAAEGRVITVKVLRVMQRFELRGC